MQKILILANKLSVLNIRYLKLNQLFNSYQTILLNVNQENFHVKGITVGNVSNIKSTLNYLDRAYEISFSTCVIDEILLGKIIFSRVYNVSDLKELNSFVFDTESNIRLADTYLSLSDTQDCYQILFTWLNDEIFS